MGSVLRELTRTSPRTCDLSDFATKPPKDTEREAIEAETEKLAQRVEELFDLLFFAGSQSFLLVLQGMDTSGKDGSIRSLLRATHAQSCRVASFKVPTAEELSHDFLWRCHKQTPGKGEIVIFNRSHYEDVGVVRVHNLVPEKVWRSRYEHINAFESLLAQNSTIIRKVFLHISKEEQEERLLEREADPKAAWKLSVGDWKEREHWDAYQEAYGDAIAECSADHAPWLILPADKKWYRNWLLHQIVIEALEPFEEEWKAMLESIGAEAKAELTAFRAGS